MKTIRSNVFETNSSSSHAIVIADSFEILDQTLSPNEEGVIEIPMFTCGEWNWKVSNNPYDKVSYLLQITNRNKSRKFIIETIEKFCGFELKLLPLKIEVMGCCFSAEEETVENYFEYANDKGADACNIKTADDIKRFVFSSKSIIFCGNDDTPPQETRLIREARKNSANYELLIWTTFETDTENSRNLNSMNNGCPLASFYLKTISHMHHKEIWEYSLTDALAEYISKEFEHQRVSIPVYNFEFEYDNIVVANYEIFERDSNPNITIPVFYNSNRNETKLTLIIELKYLKA